MWFLGDWLGLGTKQTPLLNDGTTPLSHLQVSTRELLEHHVACDLLQLSLQYLRSSRSYFWSTYCISDIGVHTGDEALGLAHEPLLVSSLLDKD